MHKAAVLIFFLTLCGGTTASGGENIPLWPVSISSGGGSRERVLPAKNGILRITDVNIPSYAVRLAPGGGKSLPALLVCPGGGYGILAWNHEGEEIAAWLNRQGISAFILKYRVPKMREKAFCDVQRAMGMIRQRAGEYGIDPSRLGIIGFSAGAHLAVRACTGFAKRAYRPVDAADALSCRPDFALIIYPAYLYRKGSYEMSPELTVTHDVPPTFLLQAENDVAFINSSLAYYIALKEKKVPAELHIFPTGGHGFGLRKRGTPTDGWGDLAQKWLKRTVGH